jgi:hypothetical protein
MKVRIPGTPGTIYVNFVRFFFQQNGYLILTIVVFWAGLSSAGDVEAQQVNVTSSRDGKGIPPHPPKSPKSFLIMPSFAPKGLSGFYHKRKHAKIF